jgi:hypothetical protein
MAWVPHSARATTRTWGKALSCSLRLLAGRPKAVALAGVSATSKTVPSIAISRQRRYHTPRLPGVPSGTTTSRNSARNGSTPRRRRAWKMAALVGTVHRVRQRLAQARPSTSERITSS